MGISRIFDISRRSLATYQKALNVTAHNIANAANPYYSRQRAILSTEKPEKGATFIWGSGIKMDTIERIRSKLIESQILTNNQDYYNHSKQSQLLSQIEQVFTEPSEIGISNLMNEFFNAWDELAVGPNSIPLRTNVIHSAENLAIKVDRINTDFDVIKTDVFNEFRDLTDTVNSYLKQINSLNAQIYQFKSVGQSPNDLLDTRDKLINELSQYANIRVSYDTKNSAILSFGGVFAVDGTSYIQLEIDNVYGSLGLKVKDTVTEVKLTGGELFGLSEIYTSKIPAYQNKIDTLFSTFVGQINSVHSAGFSLDAVPQTGIDFFDEYNNGKLVINSDILNDPLKISASGDGTGGNGDIAVQIAGMADEKVIEGSSFHSYYSGLISKMGNDKLSSDRNSEATSLVVAQLKEQRSSNSGVSIDEEMTDIIKFQRIYEASAKLIQIADEMLQTIMQMV